MRYRPKRVNLFPAKADKRFGEVVSEVWDGSALGTASRAEWLAYNRLTETVVSATWRAGIGTQEWIRDAIGLLNFSIDHGRQTRRALRDALREVG